MTQLDLTNMEATANITFEAFKSLDAQGQNQARVYYQQLDYAATNTGDQNTQNYAELAKNVVTQDDINGQMANRYTEAVAETQGIAFDDGTSQGYENKLRLQYELMQRDLAERKQNVLDGGSGELDYEKINDIHEEALNELGLPPQAFSLYVPLEQLGEYDPAKAEDLFNDIVQGGDGLLDVFDNGLQLGLGARIDASQPLTEIMRDYGHQAGWLNLMLEALNKHAQDYPNTAEVQDRIDQFQGLLNIAGTLDEVAAWLEDVGDTISSIPGWFNDFLNDWGLGEGETSPLVLDLNGNGIELAALTGADSVYWDIDQDGLAEQSGWITGGDGLLAIDLNNDGIINDHGELFGTETMDGFTVFSAYDSNSDNVINSSDTAFGDLLVWVDANQNGYSEQGELSSLTDLNITSINLNASLVDYDIAGNHITHESTFTMNGQTQTIVDAWFSYDNANSQYSEPYSLDIRTLYMPTLRGFGDVPDLHISMSLDEDLLLLVEEIAVADTTTLFDPTFDLTGKMIDIFFKWTDVENVDPTSRGTHFDGQKLAALEEYLGEDFVVINGATNPTQGGATVLNKLFDELIGTLTNHVLVQTSASVMYGENAHYNFADAILENSTLDLVDIIPVTATSSTAVTDANEAYVFHASSDSFTFNEVGGDDAIWLSGVLPEDVRLEKSGYGLKIHHNGEFIEVANQYLSDWNGNNLSDGSQIENLVFEDGTVVDLLNDVTFTGTTVGGNIFGLKTSETLIGLEGNDSLTSYSGNDILIGGVGTDTMSGGLGNDIYEWSIGDGNDNIYEEGGVDQLHLKGVTQDDVRLEATGFDLKIHVGAEYITAKNFLKSDLNLSNAYDHEMLDEIVFDDGSVIDLMGDLTFKGTDALDTIYGTNSSDTLIGKLGNDNVYGGRGDDTYIWHLGDGEDKFADSSGNDVLRIHDVQITSIALERSSTTLYVHVADKTLTIYGHFSAGDNGKIETIELDDGFSIDLVSNLTYTGSNNAKTMYGSSDGETMQGLAGNDTLNLYGGDDTLIGGLGNDYLSGGTGNDTYVWSVGDGDDNISESSGQDILELNNVLAGDIRLEAVNSHLEIYTGSENITVYNHFNVNYTGQIEFIELDDGSQIDLINNVVLTGTNNSETFRGSGFAETLNGLDGNDSIYGYDNNDVLNGGNGSDYLYGGYGDDTINGGDGIDMLYGQNGSDIFLFEALTAFNFSDNIQDFDLAQNDKFDVSDLLQGYDAVTDAITDFVQITESGSNSYLSVDVDGGADNFVQIAYIYNETGLTDEDALETSGNLITV